MKLAYLVGRQCLPEYSGPYSRHDFTEPQLFACLVVREHQKKSYRGAEALLADCPEWLSDVGMTKAPDHNTLCRAFTRLAGPGVACTMLDLMVRMAEERKLLRRRRGKPLAVDSSMFESRHVSRHFEKRRDDPRGKKSPAGRGHRG